MATDSTAQIDVSSGSAPSTAHNGPSTTAVGTPADRSSRSTHLDHELGRYRRSTTSSTAAHRSGSTTRPTPADRRHRPLVPARRPGRPAPPSPARRHGLDRVTQAGTFNAGCVRATAGSSSAPSRTPPSWTATSSAPDEEAARRRSIETLSRPRSRPGGLRLPLADRVRSSLRPAGSLRTGLGRDQRRIAITGTTARRRPAGG